MPEATGYIMAVQEQRFRFLTDDGQGLLLTLSHQAPLSGQDLCRLNQAQTHLVVRYRGRPNTTSGIAHAVIPSAVPGAKGGGRP